MPIVSTRGVQFGCNAGWAVACSRLSKTKEMAGGGGETGAEECGKIPRPISPGSLFLAAFLFCLSTIWRAWHRLAGPVQLIWSSWTDIRTYFVCVHLHDPGFRPQEMIKGHRYSIHRLLPRSVASPRLTLISTWSRLFRFSLPVMRSERELSLYCMQVVDGFGTGNPMARAGSQTWLYTCELEDKTQHRVIPRHVTWAQICNPKNRIPRALLVRFPEQITTR